MIIPLWFFSCRRRWKEAVPALNNLAAGAWRRSRAGTVYWLPLLLMLLLLLLLLLPLLLLLRSRRTGIRHGPAPTPIISPHPHGATVSASFPPAAAAIVPRRRTARQRRR
jgi:hypothetical protein